jgi:hypothetical protein
MFWYYILVLQNFARDEWVHVALVYSGWDAKYYINGAMKSQQSVSGTHNALVAASLCTRGGGVTMDSRRCHNALAAASQCTRCGVTMDSRRCHSALAAVTQCTRGGVTMHSCRRQNHNVHNLCHNHNVFMCPLFNALICL